ncbi:MAG: YwaF family protein [Clostridia bacterium]|nr:YwaF family protein [Clostridia bacterium]
MKLFTFYDWLIENKDVMGDGPGLWCPLHFVLMGLLAVWLVVCWFICKKHHRFAMIMTTILCCMLIFSRLFRMLLLLCSGTQTFVEILPWHLCHVMSFVFPLFFLTKTKKFFLAVLVVTFFGGILTFIFGDYYYLSTLSFLHIESLFLHFAMPTVVITCIASGYFKVRVKDFWQAFVGIILLAAWSMIGNLVVEDANYLYLMQNGLPFDLFAFMNWEFSYLLTYAVLVGVIALVSILPFYIYEKIKNKKKDKSFEIIMTAIKSKI